MKQPTCKKSRRAVVLDTSAFVAGCDPLSATEEQYTAALVIEEIHKNSMLGFRLKTAVENGTVKVEIPKKRFLEKVKEAASAVGDLFFLSEADLQILALALELQTQCYSTFIATDDYSIQNVASHMGIEFAPLATFGIRRRLQWTRYCPACHKEYSAGYKSTVCEVCGTEIKRKSLRKKSHRYSSKNGICALE